MGLQVEATSRSIFFFEWRRLVFGFFEWRRLVHDGEMCFGFASGLDGSEIFVCSPRNLKYDADIFFLNPKKPNIDPEILF